MFSRRLAILIAASPTCALLVAPPRAPGSTGALVNPLAMS
jgi:hypothetical protein